MPETDLFNEISGLSTELRNSASTEIDTLDTLNILKIINDQDKLVPYAIEKELPEIVKAVDLITSAFRNGGRLFYIGAGTSGRLGIVDASECPPTFGTDYEMVQGIIAGGTPAIFEAQEGAEDSEESGAGELETRNIQSPDIVCGIAASGRTPFVIGALKEATKRNIRTILITTNTNISKLYPSGIADVMICPNVGAEVITGSTRMKSGTAQKLILNMLTTASMIKLGKTYGNIMVDLQLTNKKLKERAKRILMEITGIGYDKADEILIETNGNVKASLVMILNGCNYLEAIEKLKNSEGMIKLAIK